MSQKENTSRVENTENVSTIFTVNVEDIMQIQLSKAI